MKPRRTLPKKSRRFRGKAGDRTIGRRTKIVGSSGLGPRFAMGNFKDVRFCPILNFGLLVLLKMSGFDPY